MSISAAIGLSVGVLAMMWHPSTAFATLTTFATFTGNVGVSVVGGGSTSPALPNGLTAEVPAGSAVVAAYLYTSTFDLNLGTAGSLVPNANAGGDLNGASVTYTALPRGLTATEWASYPPWRLAQRSLPVAVL